MNRICSDIVKEAAFEDKYNVDVKRNEEGEVSLLINWKWVLISNYILGGGCCKKAQRWTGTISKTTSKGEEIKEKQKRKEKEGQRWGATAEINKISKMGFEEIRKKEKERIKQGAR